MARDLKKWAEAIVEAGRKGVQVERMWQAKLEADLRKKQTEKDLEETYFSPS